MNNASIVNNVVVQLVLDGLVVFESDGEYLEDDSRRCLGAAATALAYMMVKDRKEMFFYMLELAGRAINPTVQEVEDDDLTEREGVIVGNMAQVRQDAFDFADEHDGRC